MLHSKLKKMIVIGFFIVAIVVPILAPYNFSMFLDSPWLAQKFKIVGFDINRREVIEGHPLQRAVYYQNIRWIKIFHNLGADLDYQNEPLDNTPLSWAVSFNLERSVFFLIKSGADPNSSNSQGRTPFHFSAIHCRTRLYRFILKNGGKDFKDIFARKPSDYFKKCFVPNLSIPKNPSGENLDQKIEK